MARAGEAAVVLVTWIREVADESLLLNGDEDAEARTNTWSLSKAEGESPLAGDVVAAVEETARLLGERARAMGRSGTFYVWHDVQSGQLRCSSTSSPRLPFGAELDLAVPLAAIVDGFLSSPGGVVRWEDLAEEDGPEAEFVLPVWAVEIG